MDWNGGPVETRHHHVNRVITAQHTYATDFFLKMWYDSIVKCILCNFSRKILVQVVKNVHDRFVANKGFIYTIMTTPKMNLMAQAISLHTKLCKIYKVYCLNCILNESPVNMKTLISWLVCCYAIYYFSSEYK